MSTSSTAVRPRSSSVDVKYRLPAKYVSSWIGLAAVVVLALILRPETFSGLSLALITALAGCMLVASLGQNLVVMVGSIDLAVPALMTLSAAMEVHFQGRMGATPVILICILSGVLISAIYGALISYLRLNALIVTFAANAIVAAALQVWLGGEYSLSGRTSNWLHKFAIASQWHVSNLFIVSLGLAAVTAAVLAHTRAGRRVSAVGANRRAAQMLGVRVDLLSTATYATAGGLYSIAGLLVAGLVQSPNPDLGTSYQLATITAVAIAGTAFAGGASSIASMVAAVLLLETLSQLLTLLQLSAGMLDLVQGALLILAVSLTTWLQFGRSGAARLRSRFGQIRTSA